MLALKSRTLCLQYKCLPSSVIYTETLFQLIAMKSGPYKLLDFELYAIKFNKQNTRIKNVVVLFVEVF